MIFRKVGYSMKHKYYAVVLVMSLLLQALSALSVHAATPATIGWTIKMNGDALSNNKYKMAITQESRANYGKYNFEGSQALLAIASESEKNDDNYVEAINCLKENPDGENYIFEFYAKGTVQPASGAVVSVGSLDFAFADFNKEAAIAPSGDKSWYKYSKVITLEKQSNCTISFKFYSRINGVLIDNVSICKEGSSVNLISDGGFEDFEDPEKEYDTTDYLPSNLMITPSQNALVLSWRNPASTELKQVSIYDVTDGKEQLLSDTMSINSSKLLFYKVEGLENGKKYQYKLVFSYDGKSDFVYYLGGSTPIDYSFDTLGGWNVRRWQHGVATYYCPADCMVDTNVQKSGKASLKITSNVDNTVPELKQDVYMYLERSVAMTTGKKYRMTFWQKTENFNGYFQFFVNGQKWTNRESTFTEGVGSMDWTYMECELESAGTANLRIQIPCVCEALWIDDLEFYELNDDGEPVGENLIPDGGFENVVSADVGKISEVSVETSNRKATLSWGLPDDNYAGAYLYEEKFGKYEYRGNIAADVNLLDLTGLTNGKEYKYKVVPYNSFRIAGQAQECNFYLEVPDYEVLTPELFKYIDEEWVKVDRISGVGEYKVITASKNNYVEEGLDYEQLVVVYNGNMLEKVYSTTDSLEAVGKRGKSKDIETEGIVIPDEGYKIGIFVMDSILSQNLYLSPIFIE